MGLGDAGPGGPTCAKENKRESERGMRRRMRQCSPFHSAAHGLLLGVADVWNNTRSLQK